jgi:hypothetical protein
VHDAGAPSRRERTCLVCRRREAALADGQAMSATASRVAYGEASLFAVCDGAARRKSVIPENYGLLDDCNRGNLLQHS